MHRIFYPLIFRKCTDRLHHILYENTSSAPPQKFPMYFVRGTVAKMYFVKGHLKFTPQLVSEL